MERIKVVPEALKNAAAGLAKTAGNGLPKLKIWKTASAGISLRSAEK